ncbi:MAG: helix-turn-helix transcriptional regulator [Firmicutes bacterium]|nr:helix-turn-helix transcriptional regulator [Bacillota bacterium]
MMHLDIRRDLLEKILQEKGWSKKRFARELGIDYSYFCRILRNERNPGSKFINEFLFFCKKYGLSFNEYVFIKLGKERK